MKKCILVFLMVLVAVGLFADSNYVWRFSSDIGLYHITNDLGILTHDDFEQAEEESSVLICFSNVYGDIVTLIVPDEKYTLDGKIDVVCMADSIDNIEETASFFDVSFDGGCVVFKDDDANFIYNEMKYASQKFFVLMNSQDTTKSIIFNVNCDRLYKYSSYLDESMF